MALGYLAVDEVQALVGSGLADLRVTVSKAGNTNPSGKVKKSSAILKFDPRSLTPDHDRVTGDPSESLRDMLGTDLLQMSSSCHEPSGFVEKRGALGNLKVRTIYTELG
jgi:hypothetical protein